MTPKSHSILLASILLLTACTNVYSNSKEILVESSLPILEMDSVNPETPYTETDNTIEAFESIREKTERELKEHNPIDDYLNELEMDSSTIEMISFSTYESDIWKAEMLYAYELLAQQTEAASVKETIFQIRDAYLEYVDLQRDLEAYIWFTDAFDSYYSNSNGICYGRYFSIIHNTDAANLYREQTLYLYALLNSEFNWNIEFLFTPETESETISEINQK